MPQSRSLPIDFPCLLPGDHSCSYHGSIAVQGCDYRVRLCGDPIPGGVDLSHATLHGCPKIHSLLEKHNALPVLLQRLQHAKSVHEFVVELREVLERLHRIAPAVPSLGALHERLVDEIIEIGWHSVTQVHEGPGELTIGVEVIDVVGRRHSISLRMLPDYPLTAPKCSAALPAHVELRWVSTGVDTSRLVNIVEQYAAAIASYDMLWAELEYIDAEAWVIEPEMPTGAVVYRRLAAGPHCALQVDLDPAAPRAVPECKFYGMESAVAPLRARMNQELHRWSPSRRVLENLQLLLGVDFGRPQATTVGGSQSATGVTAMEGSEQGHGAECAICYSYRLDGTIPEKMCDNVRCARCFHISCLLEWLRGVATSRTSFDTIFGECPYCTEPIFVKTTAA
eukprot:COSAG05_NODE_821_length_7122_cov_142.066781_4_plen_396_part_00